LKNFTSEITEKYEDLGRHKSLVWSFYMRSL